VPRNGSVEPCSDNSCLCWLHNSGLEQSCHNADANIKTRQVQYLCMQQTGRDFVRTYVMLFSYCCVVHLLAEMLALCGMLWHLKYNDAT
jgi:hypothetical protein